MTASRSGGRPQAYPYDMDEARCEEVLRMKEQYHLEVPMYTPEVLGYPFNIATTDEKERSETIDYLKRAIDVSRAIGAPAFSWLRDTPATAPTAERTEKTSFMC